MKILNHLLLVSVLAGATSCLKKQDYSTEVKVLSVKPVYKIKTARDLSVAGTNTTITNYSYNYDADKRVESVIEVDSVNTGGTWAVNSSSTHYQYTSFGRWSRSVRVTGMPESLTTIYVYDSNQRLRNEIQAYGLGQDTTEYIYSNNTCVSQPKYPGASYTKVYYTDGDPDSAISYLNNAVAQKSYYTYTNRQDKSYAYFIPVLPMNPSFKEVDKIVVTGNVPKTYNYSYDYGDNDFVTRKVVTSSGETVISTYAYTTD